MSLCDDDSIGRLNVRLALRGHQATRKDERARENRNAIFLRARLSQQTKKHVPGGCRLLRHAAELEGP